MEFKKYAEVPKQQRDAMIAEFKAKARKRGRPLAARAVRSGPTRPRSRRNDAVVRASSRRVLPSAPRDIRWPRSWAPPPPSTISTGPWFARTWCTRSPTTPRTSRGCWRASSAPSPPLVSVPLFAAADFYSRRLFNDMFFRPLQGRVRGPPALSGRGAVRQRHPPLDLPRGLRADRQVQAAGPAPGAGDRGPRPHGAAAGPPPGHRRLGDQPAGVRGGQGHRPAAAARDGGRHQGQLDARLRREGGAATSPTATATRTA